MTLISLNFFAFFAITLIVYYLLPGRFQWMWLLLSSLFFYYESSTPVQMGLFLLFIILNWVGTLFMGEECKHPKAAYVTTLCLDVFMLAAFKYCGFFVEMITAVIRLVQPAFSGGTLQEIVGITEELAPIRISYFALIVIGYITDVYWGKVPVQKNPGKVLLFAGYFPQMTSGPIVQYEDMQTRLWGEKHRFDYENVIRGLERVLWGVFKKLVISERAAVMVNAIYDQYEIYPGFYVFIAAGLFALQLYTDFSGLMDIVLGFSQCLGIELPENFNTPFDSVNLSEFWRRWHITLGGFLRDYVLYPIERSTPWRKMRKFCKKKFGKGYENKFNLPLYLALLISWFLIGLWHGGGWNYIFGVGLYMWIVIVVGELLAPLFAWLVKVLHINTECFSWILFQRIRTFFLFIFGLSFFRAKSLRDGFKMWKLAFSQWNPWVFFDHSLYKLGVDKGEIFIMLIGILVLTVVSILSRTGSVREKLHKQNFVFRLLVFIVLFVVVINWGYYGTDFNAADFIYGRF